MAKNRKAEQDAPYTGKFDINDATPITVLEFGMVTGLKRKKAQETAYKDSVHLGYDITPGTGRRSVILGYLPDWWKMTYPEREMPDFEILLKEIRGNKKGQKKNRNAALYKLDEMQRRLKALEGSTRGNLRSKK